MNKMKLFHRAKKILLSLIVYGIAIGFIVVMCRFFHRFKRPEFYTVVAEIKKTDELKTGAVVRMSGLDIGKVSELVLLPNFSVRVIMHIDNEYQIPDDSAIAIWTDGLLGAKYMEIMVGGSMENMQDGDEFEITQDSVNFAEMLALGLEEFKKNNEEMDKCLKSVMNQKNVK